MISSHAFSSHSTYAGVMRSRERCSDSSPVGRSLGGGGPAGNAEVGADVEQVVLYASEPLAEARGHPLLGAREPDRGVQLVHRPVGLDVRVELGNAAHVAQMRLAPVA